LFHIFPTQLVCSLRAKERITQKIGKLGERIAFELDTMKSDAPLAKQYRAILHKAQNKDDIEGIS